MPATFSKPEDIAIVGIACRFADAADTAGFWRNVLENRASIGDHPDPVATHVLDPESPRFDRLHTLRGGYLRELATFSPAAFGLDVNALPGANPDQFLAIQLATEALHDAGLWPNTFRPERAALFLGYSAPLNVATANWLQHSLIVEQTAAILQRLFPTAPELAISEVRQTMKAALPPVRPAGIRSAFGHALAGQCATALGFSGATGALDAGAASSLAALRQAMDELRLGRCDVAVTGAVQSCASLHVLMGLACVMDFTSREIPSPLSRDADGTLPGEGGAFFVLKRRSDAEKNRDTIYALVKGVGFTAGDTASSTPTEPDQLVNAIRLAQAEAGVDPETIGLVEAHGSAIPREDQMEIQALREVFADRTGALPHIAIGSVKSSIGHCFAAAGAAGLAKTALSLYHRILPPTIATRSRIHTRLAQASSPFYVNAATRPWIEGGDHPRRAGVTAFDSACAHAHAVLEEHQPDP
jgi:acyl transferase domain-containing protein